MNDANDAFPTNIVLDSVSEGVIHHARVPVLVLRGGEAAGPPERVVMGEDGYDAARAAGELALRRPRLC
jgi:hypothetical protein